MYLADILNVNKNDYYYILYAGMIEMCFNLYKVIFQIKIIVCYLCIFVAKFLFSLGLVDLKLDNCDKFDESLQPRHLIGNFEGVCWFLLLCN